jgi:prepilin peptidase CpaA
MLLFLVSPICAWVAWSDLARMKIPNQAVGALVIVFLIAGPLVLPWPEYIARWLHLAVVLLIGFGLTMAGLIGAGDAKFLAAIAPFINRNDASWFLLLTVAILLIAFALHRAARVCPAIRRLAPELESWRRREFPMGLPLAIALVAYLAVVAL